MAGAGNGGAAGAAGAGGQAGGGGDAGTSNGPCTPNDVENRACGKCGTQARLCNASGAWMPWSACVGESGECVPGTEVDEPCELCGTRKRFCSSACSWVPGPCANQGTCEAGEVTTTDASCPTGLTRTSVCSDQCQPLPWSPCSEPFSWKTLSSAAVSGRRDFGYAFGAGVFVVAGGIGPSGALHDDVGIVAPQSDAWAQMATMSLEPRSRPATVFTGTTFLVWGGRGAGSTYFGNGATLEFVANTWVPMSSTGAPSPRAGFAQAWDAAAEQFIVWGGEGQSPAAKSDGARWSMTSNQWTALPSSPLSARAWAASAWDEARRLLYVWGGIAGGAYPTDGAVFDATTNAWRAMAAPPPGVSGRRDAVAAVAGGRFVVWGGLGPSPGDYRDDGIAYDPDTDSWIVLAAAPMSGRTDHFATTDGTRVFIYGGRAGAGDVKDDGGVYDPATNIWSAIAPEPNGPGKRYGLGGVWTTGGVFLWGGEADPGFPAEGMLWEK